ncbi:MAG: sigma-54 dependent transcriptional regulator [Spirochaetes bacterium]|nr:sigma-54 dependent transcriptional regulator [Spirochaetota bacterium]MBU0955228.1 sigma-54 dependent transcriptional regulator [Spirochaetota bacterium]
MASYSLFCVDDERYIVDGICDYLDDSYACSGETDPQAALQALCANPVDILIVDYRMPGLSGLELLRQAQQQHAYRFGILLTAWADKELLKELLNTGLVYKVLEKPLDLPFLKELLDGIAALCGQEKAEQERLDSIYQLLAQGDDGDFQFVGQYGDLAEVWGQGELAAPTDENILITGATGTGKDVLARQLHRLSLRHDRPFIKINCGAIPATLIESELFGYEKGAFSGAEKRKPGRIELADGGTLFLNEIGELPPDLQTRLLHVVEEKCVERVGGTETIPVNFRLISATNRPLDLLSGREFRRDLFYRIATVHLDLPELKNRPVDLPMHVLNLVRHSCRLFGRPVLDVSPEALKLLCSYSWPGNVRELDNVIKRVVMLKDRRLTLLTATDFPCLTAMARDQTDDAFLVAVTQIASIMMDSGRSINQLERAVLESILDQCEGKVMEAARRTGIPKDRFYRIQERRNQ